MIPASTTARACRTASATGTERLSPLPCGMMQNVQAWSHPCCTSRKARARPAIPTTGATSWSRARPISPTALPAPGSQLSARSFSTLPSTRATPGIAAHRAGAICAAQPVTTIDAPGRSRCARATALRHCRSASAVTAQVFTTTVSDSPAACPRITSLS